jgi:hypothetical protein
MRPLPAESETPFSASIFPYAVAMSVTSSTLPLISHAALPR